MNNKYINYAKHFRIHKIKDRRFETSNPLLNCIRKRKKTNEFKLFGSKAMKAVVQKADNCYQLQCYIVYSMPKKAENIQDVLPRSFRKNKKHR